MGAPGGHDLHIGIGLSAGYATLAVVGFEGRADYAAIGGVMNQAARLCAVAKGGGISSHRIGSSQPLSRWSKPRRWASWS